jgi:hypothetical protein
MPLLGRGQPVFRFLINIFAKLRRRRTPPLEARTSLPPSTSRLPVAVLDTNTVHYARLYLSLAREHALPPFGSGTGDINNDLRTILGPNRTLDSYKKGSKLFIELANRSNAGWQIKYSRFTALELACGGLRARFIEDALKERMPSRWWNRIDEGELLDRLTPDAYEEVEKEIDDLESMFDSAGITISEFDIHRLPDVFQAAKLLLGLVFLEEGDCVVYAGALVEEADEVWTSDTYLKTVVAGIENPGSAKNGRQDYFREVNKKVREGLARIISVDPADLQLPKAI